MNIVLKTFDGVTFSVKRSVIEKSITINNLLDDRCADSDGIIHLQYVDGKTLSRVIEYLSKHAELWEGSSEINAFDENFTKGHNIEEIFDLVMVAYFLEIEELLDLINQKIADIIKNMHSEEDCKFLNLENDLIEEEEEAGIRNESAWIFEDLNEDALRPPLTQNPNYTNKLPSSSSIASSELETNSKLDMNIVLKTFDGVTFSVKRSLITKSVTIKNLLDDRCAYSDGIIHLQNVDGKTLSRVIEYLSKHEYLSKYADPWVESSEIKAFDENFTQRYNNIEEIYDLAMAAYFLKIKELLDLICQKIADMIKIMYPEEVCKFPNEMHRC